MSEPQPLRGASMLRTLTFRSGAPIWERGDCTAPVRVTRGAVLMTQLADGRLDLPLALFTAGSVALPHPANANTAGAISRLVALTDCEVEPLPGPHHYRYLGANERAVEALVWMAELQAGCLAPVRGARILLVLHLAAQVFPDEPKRWIPFTQEQLATAVGVRRETFNTTLCQWREAGVLELRYRKLRVLDEPALRRLAADPEDPQGVLPLLDHEETR